MLKEFVIIRGKEAGIHCGILEEDLNGSVILRDARRIWRWGGANTLHELALHGADTKKATRISESIGRIKVIGVYEILPCTEKAQQNLTQSRWLD